MGPLNTFPLSLKVKGRRVVIVGGGAEALAKARLLARTSADTVVIARELACSEREFPVPVIVRSLTAADLDGAAMVFVAEDGADADLAERIARERNIPLNVVDIPERCDFYTPSIVERAPLVVAVSSEGASPVLARLVRARIEAMLPMGLGKIASLAGQLRGKVESLIHDGAGRRRFYEALVGSPTITNEADAETLLTAHAAGGGRGEVWLIGAGPGSEDLLTLRAQRLLQEADVILFDHLVPEPVVEMGRRDAERISVGKGAGRHVFTQAQINTLMVRLAGEGKRVARLKSGDPMVFGRAGEEIAALRKAGVPYTIVPGVSAALAAAADMAVPVTLRRVSPGLVVATAHGADDGELPHWAGLAKSGMTLALYMGKAISASVAERLIAAELAATTPVGVVVNAGRPERSGHVGTLGALAAGGVAFADGPAVILIGNAVAEGDWAGAADIAATELVEAKVA